MRGEGFWRAAEDVGPYERTGRPLPVPGCGQPGTTFPGGEGKAAPLRRFATPLPDVGRGKRCKTEFPRRGSLRRATARVTPTVRAQGGRIVPPPAGEDVAARQVREKKRKVVRFTRFPAAEQDPAFSLIRPRTPSNARRSGAPSPAGGRTAGCRGRQPLRREGDASPCCHPSTPAAPPRSYGRRGPHPAPSGPPSPCAGKASRVRGKALGGGAEKACSPGKDGI